MGGVPNPFHRTTSIGDHGQFSQPTSDGPVVGIEVPSQSVSLGPVITFSLNRTPDPLPMLMSRYWATRATIANLRVEQQYLRRKINSLTSHSIVHDDYCSFIPSSQRHMSEQAASAREGLSLRGKAYLDLVMAHCNSVHGEFAENYYELFFEYALLQKLYRLALARTVVTRYHAQRLVIKAGRVYYPPSTSTPPICATHVVHTPACPPQSPPPEQLDAGNATGTSPPDLFYPPEEVVTDARQTFPISFVRDTRHPPETI
ncbi:hypothetical protein BJ322DRAFT_1105308 [Thelephora terrestris]|nr:hypothetical protein BJ322DRAFT_1105308 [Thelephora terrestris]